jgi:hypothetical protein
VCPAHSQEDLQAMAEESTVGSTSAARKDVEKVPESIYLVSYPKIVFLYPTFFLALAAGIFMLFFRDKPEHAHVVGMVFLALFAVNMIVFSFDFPRTTSLTLFFFLVALGIGLYTLFRFNPTWLPVVNRLITSITPYANATFYFSFAALLALIYLAVVVSVQFDYWEVRPNELLHHHGFLSDLERFSAPNLRIDKEINDVFEYLLLRSGRLILHPSNERRAIVLENVFPINSKETQITRMLSALQVQVRTGPS